ncbi:P-type ATPase [Streptosporangium sp. H16]|uniref:P-type ATPase n=1 Tax=Streptosporangium sp. H16 TaxID=3444184 RepID=UPI003F7A59B5
MNAADLVTGDLVLLEAGDRISADLELAETHELAVNESMLTGESVPRRPREKATVFAGTFVVEGEAAAVVTATGPRTRLADPASAAEIMRSAVLSSTGRLVRANGRWKPVGDPMEVALHALALRAGSSEDGTITRRLPFDPVRRRSSVIVDGVLHLKGAPDTVLPLCAAAPGAEQALQDMRRRGLRVLAVARRAAPVVSAAQTATQTATDVERDLTLLGLVGLEDPPREDVAEAIERCRLAGIKLAMITGDPRRPPWRWRASSPC